MSTAMLSPVTGKPLTEEFERIFREHYRLVYRTAFRVTRSAEDAEDVLQTVFLRFLRHELPQDLKKNPKSYLYRAAVNASIDIIRFREKRVLVSDPENFETAGEVDTVTSRLYEAIAELSPSSAHVFILRYVHNYTDAEIAELLGTTRGTVAVSLYRSRARLKKIIRGWLGARS